MTVKNLINIFNDKPTLPIAVKRGERVGDAISKYLENKFVEFTKNQLETAFVLKNS